MASAKSASTDLVSRCVFLITPSYRLKAMCYCSYFSGGSNNLLPFSHRPTLLMTLIETFCTIKCFGYLSLG